MGGRTWDGWAGSRATVHRGPTALGRGGDWVNGRVTRLVARRAVGTAGAIIVADEIDKD